MNEVANWNILLFLVTCASFNGNAQGNNPGPNQVAGGVQRQGNNPNQNPVAGGGVQGQGNNPNQNPVAGGDVHAKGNIRMDKMPVFEFLVFSFFHPGCSPYIMYIISEKKVIEMPGSCEFSNPDHDYSNYDYVGEHDFDFADEDKEQCLQTCLQKSKLNPNSVGCHFEKDTGHCVFLKTGTIVGSSGASDPNTCWKFHKGNIFAD